MATLNQQQRTRANSLANLAMKHHGLDPKLDQRKRPPYFAVAYEVVAKHPPATLADREHLEAFDHLRGGKA